ncbi:MAG: 16S rRNA (guanine(527)-N(7))-methyltransferase RsmG [Defluviitaleaceae bacterium]|nr:16S rRNA (guanine(527)-N(7))-methyltransferase RsmG [Defluviitaleaceae bacterium]
MNLKQKLKESALELGIELTQKNLDQLWVFKDFLKEYNEKVNLTAIKEDEDIVIKHFLDSLTVLPYVDGKVIDIGTGPGFPGIVLKIVKPCLDITLLDARGKKVKFLEEAAELLNLENITCIHGRAEEISSQKGFSQAFDCAVSRAVGSFENLAKWCLPFVKEDGQFIAMKGPNYEEELEEGKRALRRHGGAEISVQSLTLPQTNLARNLIIIKKSRVL